MYLLINSITDITQLIPAGRNLFHFIQLYASENVLQPPPSWLACVTTLNILTFCVMLTECICVLYVSQNKQRLLPYTTVTGSLTGFPFMGGPVSSVGIATDYGLEGP